MLWFAIVAIFLAGLTFFHKTAGILGLTLFALFIPILIRELRKGKGVHIPFGKSRARILAQVDREKTDT